MIRLKVFISSVQKELRSERTALASLLATDPFLASSTVPRLFEEYPAPLRPNKQAYLDLLRTCHAYLLVIGKEYGTALEDGLSATHQEYRLAQQLKLPTLVCLKGDNSFSRDDEETAFLKEVRDAGHTYTRFQTTDDLLKAARDRLTQYIKDAFDTAPTPQQNEYATETIRSASDFERQLVSFLSFDDLDIELSKDLVAAAEDRDPEKLTPDAIRQALASRGYVWFDTKDQLYRPTAAATLLLAKSPAKAFSQARLQLDAYAGNVRNERPLDSVLLDAPLSSAIEQAVAFVRRNTANPLRVEGLHRADAELYPQEALREAVANAVAHRDYSESGAKVTIEVFANRIVCASPGFPPGGQSIDRIIRGEARSRARNPLLVQGLTWLGLMDERGSGIRRMRAALQHHNLTPPSFELVNGEFVVTFLSHPAEATAGDPEASPTTRVSKADPFLALRVTDRQRQILRLAVDRAFVTSSVCVQVLGIVKDTAVRDLNDLISIDYLRKQGTGRGTQYIPTATLTAEISSDLRPVIGRESDANQTHHAGDANSPTDKTDETT